MPNCVVLSENQHNSKFIPTLIFAGTIILVFFTIIPSIFPALYAPSIDTERLPFNGKTAAPFELGELGIPIIITNIIFVTIWFLHFKKSSIFSEKISWLRDKKLSKRNASIIFFVLLSIYIGFSTSEIFVEETFADYKGVKEKTESWSLENAKLHDVPLRFWFLSLSLNVFENIRFLPFVASITLIGVTYIFTANVTNNRISGLIAVIFLIQSKLFLNYDTTATYENFWFLFFLISLYFISRKTWQLSPIFYFLSIPLKALTAAFLPISILYILRENMVRKRKILLVLVYIIVSVVGFSLLSFQDVNIIGTQLEFQIDDFVQGFATMAFQLRTESLLLVFLPHLVFGLFLLSKKGFRNCEQILVVIAGLLLIIPLITGMTLQTAQPYRLIPLVTFFAIGVGALLSRFSLEESQQSK